MKGFLSNTNRREQELREKRFILVPDLTFKEGNYFINDGGKREFHETIQVVLVDNSCNFDFSEPAGVQFYGSDPGDAVFPSGYC